jgi:hypothetical protein
LSARNSERFGIAHQPTAGAERPVEISNFWFLGGIVLLVGAALRLAPVVGSPYPLNDGGLFYAMSGDIVRNGFLLPMQTTYNGGDLPFAYPPLAPYIAALLSQMPGFDLLQVIRWLPSFLGILTIPAFFLVAQDTGATKFRAVLATAAFAVIPRAYSWLVVGGGLTRSLGLLLALCCVHELHRAFRTGSTRNLMSAALLSGLVLLTHPQAALFVGISSVLIMLRAGISAANVARLIGTAILAVGVAIPWIVAVISSHSIEVFAAAGESSIDLGAGLSSLAGLAFSDLSVIDLVTALGIIGLFMSIARREWFLPAWLVALVVLDPRAGTTFAVIPLAILATIPLARAIIPRLATVGEAALEAIPLPRLVVQQFAASLFLGLLLFAALRTASRAATDPMSPLNGVNAAEAATMSWMAITLPADSSVVVITGKDWQLDAISEWFPILAEHSSVATVQGTEWTHDFLNRLAEFRELQTCATTGLECVRQWSTRWRVGLDQLYVAPDCCPAIREDLENSDAFTIHLNGDGGLVAEHRPG